VSFDVKELFPTGVYIYLKNARQKGRKGKEKDKKEKIIK
jgi:hypothetical protein